MYIILGGTGHVGKAVADELIAQNKKVTVITHNRDKVEQIEKNGAFAVVADVMDADQLRKAFSYGRKLFLLNPPANPKTDTAAVERESLKSILKALEDSGIEKVVAESTVGAQPGNKIGDLGVLYEMEQELQKLPLKLNIIRAGYYYTNWDGFLETAKRTGKIYTMYPPDFKLPMAAPQDIGRFAAGLISSDNDEKEPYDFLSPDDYCANDVAKAFSKALDKPVIAEEIPESGWTDYLKSAGFCDEAAKSMAAMTKITLDKDYRQPKNIQRGITTIDDHVEQLVKTDSLNDA
jgi:uncharacterized protein YbjT (DUF2867 family)